MRCNPWRWTLGLIPLGLLCGATVYFERDRIEGDLRQRAEGALQAAGLKWAQARIDGRDAVILGKALDEGDPVRAQGIARDVWGVRVADAQVDLVEKADNFVWYASRDGNRVRLRGMVPNEDTRAAIIGVARQSFTGGEVQDEMQLKRGVPNQDTWLSGVTFALKQLAGLKSGEARLDGLGLSVTGEATTGASYRGVRTALSTTLPRGVRLNSDRVTAPVVSPYVWTARLANGAVVLAGHVPSDRAREDLVATTRAAFPRVSVTDQMEAAEGAPQGFVAAAQSSLKELAKLEDGRAETRDAQLTVAGLAADEAAAETARRNIRGAMPQGFRFADNIKFKAPPPPKVVVPYITTAALNPGAVVLTGFAPNEAARDAVGQQARVRFPGRQIDNRLEIANGAPEGWQRCLDGGMLGIARLGNGRLQMSDKRLDVAGATEDEDLAEAVPGDVRQAVRGDCDANVRVDVLAEAIPDLNWRASRRGSEVVLEGDVPSAAIRAALMQQAGQLFRGAVITDRMRVVETKTRKWPRVAELGLKTLADLKSGEATLSRQQLTVTGEAGEQAIATAARARLERDLQKGYAGREQIIVGVVVPVAPAAPAPIYTPPQPAPPAPVYTPPPPVQTVAAPPASTPRYDDRAKVCQDGLQSAAKEGIIRFQRASAELDRASYQTLDRLVGIARSCPSVLIEIEGHTDAEGTPDRKQRLSDRRAQSVADYLVRAGVEQAKLSAVGYADARPLAPNDTPDNRAKNRRIEFTVKPN